MMSGEKGKEKEKEKEKKKQIPHPQTARVRDDKLWFWAGFQKAWKCGSWRAVGKEAGRREIPPAEGAGSG